MMEGGGVMEGRGSDVGYWRGETRLSLLFPVSTRCFPCPRVVSHVHASFPMSARRCPCPRVDARVRASVPASARRCPCPRVVARVRTSLPVSTCHCPCPFTFVGGRFRSWAWVVAFVGGRSSSFVGNGSVVVGSRWWMVVSLRGWR